MLLFISPPAAQGVDRVELVRDGVRQQISGKVVVKAADGGLLVYSQVGQLWTVEPQELISHREDNVPFAPMTAERLSTELLKELPPGFEIHTTAHYVICYNTSRVYAQWCGALFERLYKASTNYWAKKKMPIREPEVPLVAIVFANRESYIKHAQEELGEAAPMVVGYYSLRTNRITMYDLTGVESLRGPNSRRGTTADINAMLSQPQALAMVSTVIHEATHQIACNSGVQTRYTDIPLWVA